MVHYNIVLLTYLLIDLHFFQDVCCQKNYTDKFEFITYKILTFFSGTRRTIDEHNIVSDVADGE